MLESQGGAFVPSVKPNELGAAPRTADGRFVPGQSYSLSTQFQRGARVAPATEFKPGERVSIATEFKAGQAAHNHLPVGTVRVRRETHTGLDRAWVKTAEPNEWRKRAVVVWESLHGKVPRGSVVHHRDRDSLNDEPNNLQALTRKEHADEHRAELELARAQNGANFAHTNRTGRMA